MNQVQPTSLVKPTDRPSAVIQRGLAVYMNNERSLVPQDIMQSIQAAEMMIEAAQKALEEAQARRRALIEGLGGQLAAA